MESERDYARQRLERKLERTQDMMLWTLLGLIGFILGTLNYVIGGIGFLLLMSAGFIEIPAYLGRKNPVWSARVRAYAYAMAAFGGGAVLGFAARLWIEII